MSSADPNGRKRLTLRRGLSAPAQPNQSSEMHMSFDWSEVFKLERENPNTLALECGYTPIEADYVEMDVETEPAQYREFHMLGGYVNQMVAAPQGATVTMRVRNPTRHAVHAGEVGLGIGWAVSRDPLLRLHVRMWKTIVARMPPPRTVLSSWSRMDGLCPSFYYMFIHRHTGNRMGAYVHSPDQVSFDCHVFDLGPEDGPMGVTKAMVTLEKRAIDVFYALASQL